VELATRVRESWVVSKVVITINIIITSNSPFLAVWQELAGVKLILELTLVAKQSPMVESGLLFSIENISSSTYKQ